ncbi:MAG: DUF1800 domain-containing protein [Oligoflexia bacterium]|nr:DUF1800 domain-containing protein [Oligoflexia bacterium]
MLAALFSAGLAAADSVKISAKNHAFFQQLSVARPYFTCYRKSQASGSRLGTLNQRRANIGARWSPLNMSELIRTKNQLAQTLRHLASGGKRSPAYRQAKRDLDQARSALAKAQDYKRSCQTLRDGEFGGDQHSLSAYRDALTAAEAKHLLRKVAFGGSPELLTIGTTQGLTALVNALVDGISPSSEETRLDEDSRYWTSQVFYYDDEDPEFAGIRIWNIDALQIGQFYRYLYARNPLKEWMQLVLSAHFATNLNAIGFSYSKFYGYGIYLHWALLRREALGNIRSLTKSLLTDPAMNFWLDNKDNEAEYPNQNFARELMELFLVGAHDPVTGQANYEEDSVVAATGFASGYYETFTNDPETGKEMIDIQYSSERHDTTARTIFSGIPGAQLSTALAPEQLVDQILDYHPGSPRYLAERLAGQMLYPGLNEAMVAELAAYLKASDYELKPFLKKVLKSQAMFSEAARAPCLSSPIENLITLARRLRTGDLARTPEELHDQNMYYLLGLRDSARAAGQAPYEPASVFGWKGACNINRAGQIASGEGFLSDQQVLNRNRACLDLVSRLSWIDYDLVGALGLTSTMDAEQMIDQVARKLFDLELSLDEKTILVRYLTHQVIDGQTIYELPDIESDYFVWRKIARLICLIQETAAANTR